MEVALWIVAGLLAAAYVASAAGKLATPYEKLVKNPNMAWLGDFPPPAIKGIGTAEVLGAAGLVLPELTGVAEVLTPIAATGLVLLQVGAMITHGRRREFQVWPINLVLLVLAAFVAVGRFAGWS